MQMQDKLQQFKEKSRAYIAMTASNLETVVSIIVLAAILIVSVRILSEVFSLFTTPDYYATFNSFLGHAFNIVIGIEFIKMLAKHTPGSAIEVLLFTIAREMVVNHTTPIENLIGIMTIALIFIIRKYLFVPSFGEHVPHSIEKTED